MKSNSIKTFTAIAVIICGFATVFFLSGFIEKNKPALPEGYADEDLALQGARLKGYSLGFEGLIADWYWMQSLQYLGDKIVKNPDADYTLDNLNPLNPRLLYPLLDNATTLDPRFTSVYEYGAVVLPAIDKDKAIKFLEKGIADNPNEWRLYQHLGYIYWRLGNYEKASEIYAKGAKIPNAPQFMLMMAAKTKTEGGSRETARIIYQQMFDESQDEQIKESAALRLLELQSLDERDAIRFALQTFKEKNNRCANNWREILPLLQTVKLPDGKDFRIDRQNNLIDPSGAPYILDKENCDVRLDIKTTKIPLK
ncbi:MAG: tetratricopeptide repeat protein [Pyrinomonadaceae bacterium]